MLTKFKKSFTIALAVVMCLSTVCASAKWYVKDYDNRNITYGVNQKVEIVYEERDDAGIFTGRMANAYGERGYLTEYAKVVLATTEERYGLDLKPFADLEFKNYWVEAYYPNNQYVGAYADGKFLGKYVATGKNGVADKLVNYKDVDFDWEVAAPFGIYSIKKAWLNIGGVNQWFGTVEAGYPTAFTGRYADVKVSKPEYGFLDYKVANGKVATIVEAADERIWSAWVNPTVWNAVEGINAESLRPTAVPAERIYIDRYADIKVPATYEYTLVGPAFDANGVATPAAKTVKAIGYKGDLANFGYAYLLDVAYGRDGALEYCDITWTAGGYELESPHNVYEYLTINGVVMDGSAVEVAPGKVVYLPNIVAYTGAVANNVY